MERIFLQITHSSALLTDNIVLIVIIQFQIHQHQQPSIFTKRSQATPQGKVSRQAGLTWATVNIASKLNEVWLCKKSKIAASS